VLSLPGRSRAGQAPGFAGRSGGSGWGAGSGGPAISLL